MSTRSDHEFPAGDGRCVAWLYEPSGDAFSGRRPCAISPGVFVTVAFHRPVRHAKRVRGPLWVGAGTRDITVSRKSVERLADRAPKGELHRYPYDHFEPFLGEGPGRVAADQIEFLRRTGVLTD